MPSDSSDATIDSQLGNQDMTHFTFMVNDQPYCLWDLEPDKRTTEFLKSVDPGYFSYLAEAHAENIDAADNKRRVATAARMAYLHGIETLMTLAGAAVQAPQTPYAWVALAKTDLLRSVVERICKADSTLHAELHEWDRTWDGLASRVFSHCTKESGWIETAASFGKVWGRFAHDFLDENNQLEYNSLKHGFRIKSSGVRLAIGQEPSYGVAPPRHEMKYLGGSDNGSTFYVVERAGPDVPGTRSKRSRQRTVNWDPETMIRGLQVIDVSIRNLVAFMQIANGAQANTIQFHRLEGIKDFSALLDDEVHIRSASFDFHIPDSSVPATTKGELLGELASFFPSPA